MTRPLKVNVIGGGPGGLYFAILMKLAEPLHEIDVFERNRADDTFGFGVVFSDETLATFTGQDAQVSRDIEASFAYWDTIEVRYRGSRIRSSGHGFCGMARMRLLEILQARARELGVRLRFETDVRDVESLRDCDLLLGADGVNSAVRERWKDAFQPTIDMRKTKFVWLGTTQKFDAFTFIFKETEHGWFYNHAYQYGQGIGRAASTWILETHEDTWRKAGLANASETDTLKFFEAMFAEELAGHPLLANKSVWRNFPVIANKHWHHENVALIGDACHTAQFSIGSGTKIAMEDAIALSRSLNSEARVDTALAAYQAAREGEVGRLQAAALVSLQWYENARRYNSLSPEQYAFNFLTRSKSVTYENLALRDAVYGGEVPRWYAQLVKETQGFDVAGNDPPPPMFTPFRVGRMMVQNRVVVSPMCQYTAEDGLIGDWQVVHLGGLAVGGAGLVFTEMTNVSRDGRITLGCAGMYEPEHRDAWRRVVDFIHGNSRAKICLQLGHAGRKGATRKPWESRISDDPLIDDNWSLISASAIPYHPYNRMPKAMDRADMDRVRDDFVRATRLAEEAGFDMIELHMAHGYLLSSFISPLSNRRDDDYGGSLANRMRFPLAVLAAVRRAWPKEKPISVRISATDWVESGGLTGDDAVEVAKMLKSGGADIINVSAGQTSEDAKPVYGRMFQTPFSEQIRLEADVPTITAGNITSADQVNTIIAAGRADLVALARPHLSDPHFTLHAAAHYGYRTQVWPDQYLMAKSAEEHQAAAFREREIELLKAHRPPSHAKRAAD